MSVITRGTLVVDGPPLDQTRALRRGSKATFTFMPKKGGRRVTAEVTVVEIRHIIDGVYFITYKHGDSVLLMSYNAVDGIGMVVRK